MTNPKRFVNLRKRRLFGWASIADFASGEPHGHTTTYAYDTLNRLTGETNELSATRSYGYDAASNLTSQTDRNGRVTNFTYDGLNRLTAELWKNGGSTIRTLSYSYDATGKLLSAGDADSAFAYTYDAANRLTQVDNNGTPSVPRVILTVGYDNLDRRTSLSATVAGTADFLNGYSYDALGRMTQVTQQGQSGGNTVAAKRVDLSYNGAGNFAGISRYANLAGTQLVASTTYGYDNDNRLTSLSHDKGGTNLASYTWSFDNAGRLTATTNADGSTSYTYDAASQLTAADHSYQTDEAYSYDANGNRTNSGYSTGTNNRVTSDGTYNYTYDSEGNRTRKTTISGGAYVDYTWDYHNRLTDVTFKTSGGTTTKKVHYTYDVFDRPLGKQVDTNGDGTYDSAQWFVSDGADTLLAYDGAGSLTNRYLTGPVIDQVFADERASGALYWSLADNLGTVRDVAQYNSGTNTTSVVNHIKYDSFGQITAQSDSGKQPLFAYTGRQWDSDTGLQYTRARWFDPRIGRFLSEDPLGIAAGDFNLTRYVANQPVQRIDPSGMRSEAVDGPDGAAMPLNSVTDSDVYSYMTTFNTSSVGEQSWMYELSKSAYDFVVNTPRDAWLVAHSPVDSALAFFKAYVMGQANIALGVYTAGLTMGAIPAAMILAPSLPGLVFGYFVAAAVSRPQGASLTLEPAPINGPSIKDMGASMATLGLSDFLKPIEHWALTGDPTQFQRQSGAFAFTTLIAAIPGRPQPPRSMCPAGPKVTCFVAGTDVLVADLAIAGTDDTLEASENAGSGDWYLAASGLAVLIAVNGIQLRRRSRRKPATVDEQFREIVGWEQEEAVEDSTESKSQLADGATAVRSENETRAEATERREASSADCSPLISPSSADGTELRRRENVRTAGSVVTERVKKPRRRIAASTATIAFSLLVALVFGAVGVSSRPRVAHLEANATPASVRSRPIETLHVGDRVLTNVVDSRGEPITVPVPEDDKSTWRRLRLQSETRWDDGTLDVFEVETLQSPDWVAEHGAQLGAEVPLPLDLLEMGLNPAMRATVVANEPCPQLQRGPGRLVLTTVNHLNADLRELVVQDAFGKQQTIRPTGLHKFYSATRDAWISAGELREGERLQGLSGPVAVVSVAAVPGVHRVYNMAVEGEHVYRVSALGVLVHNPGCSTPGEIPPIIYREGNDKVKNLIPRLLDEGVLSGRDSLSNPIVPGIPGPPNGRAVMRPGEPYIAIDTGKLPVGSVNPDGIPPGHVGIINQPPEVVAGAIIPKPPVGPYGPGASGKFPK